MQYNKKLIDNYPTDEEHNMDWNVRKKRTLQRSGKNQMEVGGEKGTYTPNVYAVLFEY